MLKKNLMLVMSICLVLVLAACGTANNSSSASGGSSTDTSTNNQDNSAGSGEPRIASMSIHLTNDLLSLGITPVGSVIGGEAKGFLSHVADRLQNTTPLGRLKTRIWKLCLL